MSVQVGVMSIDEFVRLYDQEGPFELIDGERVNVEPPMADHLATIIILFRLIDTHCLVHKFGRVFTETPYALSPDSKRVEGSRLPDLSFYTAQRWEAYTAEMADWHTKPVLLVPDLVIEIVSLGDLYTEIQPKINRYRKDGVRLVWVIELQRKTIGVYSGDQYTSYDKDAELKGGDVIPGFSVPVSLIFISPD